MLLMAQHDSLVSLSETLDQPSLDHHVQSQSEPTNSPASTAAAAAVAVAAADQSQSFSRNASFGRLNAQAPEFVPRTSSSSPSSSSAMTQPRVLIPPPPPPGLVHMYHAPNSPFHVPIPGHGVAVPVQNNHLYAHHVPVQYHHQHHPHPHHHRQSHPQHRQYYGGAGSNSAFVDQQEVASVQTHAQQAPQVDLDQVGVSRNGLSEEATQKILNQVEYYFSDVNLATTDHLMRFIHKDPEGYVPISVVASFKKIKAFTCNNSQLASILRNSQKLAVSEDGKKVRRQHPLTESDMEELQSRIVVAENLPEDHCHQNLMKIFSAVGSVKSIRTCQPQTSNGGTSSASRTTKAEGMLFYNKLHAFVEYESVELAEKAIADLNDEGNWRNGLRVRLLLRRTTKSGQSRVKTYKEDDASTSEQQQPNQKHLEDLSQQSEPLLNDHAGEEHGNEEGGGQRKGRNRGRGGRGGRGRPHNHRGNQHAGVAAASSSSSSPASNSYVNGEVAGKQPPPGPRMPDGTRGFSMGRGKPIAA